MVSRKKEGALTPEEKRVVKALLNNGWRNQDIQGHCQTNLNRPAKDAGSRRSRGELPPLGQGGRAVLLEDVAAIEVAFVIEMIVDRGVDGGEFLQGLDVPELCHRPLSSSKRLV